jgi:hypothetical protein
MQMTKEIRWTAADFVAAATMFALVGAGLELAVRAGSSRAYRGGAALALIGGLLTVWTNLAVGIVGSEENPANLLFFVALAVGVAGTALVRARPAGMSAVTFATAISISAAFVAAINLPTDEPFVSHVTEATGAGLFTASFLGAGFLFRKAARAA